MKIISSVIAKYTRKPTAPTNGLSVLGCSLGTSSVTTERPDDSFVSLILSASTASRIGAARGCTFIKQTGSKIKSAYGFHQRGSREIITTGGKGSRRVRAKAWAQRR